MNMNTNNDAICYDLQKLSSEGEQLLVMDNNRTQSRDINDGSGGNCTENGRIDKVMSDDHHASLNVNVNPSPQQQQQQKGGIISDESSHGDNCDEETNNSATTGTTITAEEEIEGQGDGSVAKGGVYASIRTTDVKEFVIKRTTPKKTRHGNGNRTGQPSGNNTTTTTTTAVFHDLQNLSSKGESLLAMDNKSTQSRDTKSSGGNCTENGRIDEVMADGHHASLNVSVNANMISSPQQQQEQQTGGIISDEGSQGDNCDEETNNSAITSTAEGEREEQGDGNVQTIPGRLIESMTEIVKSPYEKNCCAEV
eukprot:CAMPEP_0170782068 /NCGR_PEP_ID=MMETSP0733-20121128/14625_1 /TAXON_ID=186038 /ORGANISM="Fragilariopsis kerguelensis, Strain L26-C5" /LENGTH=309 /DNA_ID=CAMNT_0011126329 /DNA_START=118 /DNA_END=1043 /DNA_ORIENTATION=+